MEDKKIYLVWDGSEDIAGVFDTLKAADWFVEQAVERTGDEFSFYVTDHALNRGKIQSWRLKSNA